MFEYSFWIYFATLSIVLAFFFFNFIILRSNLSWIVKSISILSTVGFFCLQYVTIQSLLGWPYQSNSIEQMRVIGVDVQPPNSNTNFNGRIYIYGYVLSNTKTSTIPKSVSIPYSKIDHEEAEKVRKQINQGQQAYIKGIKSKGKNKPETTISDSRFQLTIPPGLTPQKDYERK